MKKIICCGIVMMFFSQFTFAEHFVPFPTGKYSFTQEGEKLIDGSKASITWNISIKDDSHAVVKISSWHAPFSCDGKYTVSRNGDQLALSWSDKDNPDVECNTSSPQILLKKSSSGKVLAHSELFAWDPDGWKNMRVIK